MPEQLVKFQIVKTEKSGRVFNANGIEPSATGGFPYTRE